MKKTVRFAALTALFLSAGCSTTTTLTTPKQHPEKYALQVVRIEVPLPETYPTMSSYAIVSDDVESLLKNPDAVITEFPVVYAAVGETGINDQTETLVFPDIDDHAKVGQYVELTLKEVGNGYARCDLLIFDQAFLGMQKMGEALTPIFTKQEIKTQPILVPVAWLTMGREISEEFQDPESGETKTVRTKTVLAVRILPPANTL